MSRAQEPIVPVASITKMFTAATLLRMIEDNPEKFPEGAETRLSHFEEMIKERFPSTAPFFEYLKEQPHYKDVTLKNLLQHTHGFGNITPACFNDILTDPEKQWGAADGLQAKYLIATDKDKFDEYNYSNAGYYLLGAVIEAVSGQSYAHMVKELVIKPLKLEHTYTYEDKIPADKPIAQGYRNRVW